MGTELDTNQVSEAQLSSLIRQYMRKQGYRFSEDGLVLPSEEKKALRRVHALAVQTAIAKAEPALRSYEPQLLRYIANGDEVVPPLIQPKLLLVQPDTEYARLFRYASLHWSIPVSNGYGRRLRFLIFDESNGKLIGLLGLADPVFSLRARDAWVGWSFEQRKARLAHVMDAYVLGAVPPYSRLLMGKFIAMVATSFEIAEAFRNRYAGQRTVLNQRVLSGDLAMVTTMSALGRSSLYNRVKFGNRPLLIRVGFTVGWGTFHFANGLYEQLLAFAQQHCEGTAKAEGWGGGKFRNRHEVVRKCLKQLGLPEHWLRHQVRREIFVAPLARNTCEFLRGETEQLDYWCGTMAEYFAFFRERWLLPRAARDESYKQFHREEWRLWQK
ncbi:MAG: hypothetical protein KatS3mg016_1792 [Fimbriimonadales bacterium]|nr:MAG: hypothetical protein KatS3mg016_1792 [Fimbriimonadales bacterium]